MRPAPIIQMFIAAAMAAFGYLKGRGVVRGRKITCGQRRTRQLSGRQDRLRAMRTLAVAVASVSGQMGRFAGAFAVGPGVDVGNRGGRRLGGGAR